MVRRVRLQGPDGGLDETTALEPVGETRGLFRCGWCGNPTANPDRCTSCGHVDPARPWVHRGQEPPVIKTDAAGRPGLDVGAIRRRLREARHALGPDATQAQLADHLSISARTLGRWQKVAD